MDNERLNILKLLIESKEETFSIRQISLHRKINYKSAYISTHQLAKEGIVAMKKQGNTTVCSYNNTFNSTVFQVEYQRQQELLKRPDFKVLHNRLSKVKEQFILLLFGSYAKGKEKKGSDIDLLLISDDPKPVEAQIRLIPLDIHLTHITYDSFTKMLKSKEFTVVSEAQKNNILLFGIEDYYRLINNA